MVEVALEVLFAKLGSEVVLLTVAVFTVSDPELKVEAVTLMVTSTWAPTLMEPRLQFTWRVEGYGVTTLIAVVEQEPCGVKEETYVVVDGMLSETVTPCATAGPLFEMASV